MPQTCSICRHEKRAEIERGLIAGEPLRAVAGRYGTSKAALERHRVHVAGAIAKAQEAIVVDRGDALLHDVEDLRRLAAALGAKAEGAKDYRGALQSVRELTRLIELQARLIGDLQSGSSGSLADPRWVALRDEILAALRPHPAACADVMRALVRRQAVSESQLRGTGFLPNGDGDV